MQRWESSQEGESLYLLALRRYEEMSGVNHTLTLEPVNDPENAYTHVFRPLTPVVISQRSHRHLFRLFHLALI